MDQTMLAFVRSLDPNVEHSALIAGLMPETQDPLAEAVSTVMLTLNGRVDICFSRSQGGRGCRDHPRDGRCIC